MAAVLAAFVMQPAAAARAGLSGSGLGCPVATGLPAATGQVVQFTGSLSCYEPGGSRFGGTVTRPTVVQRLTNPTLGAPCRNTYFYPVTFTEGVGTISAVFSFAGGAATSAPRGLTGADALMAGTNEAVVSDVQLGSYQLSNPNDPNSPLICVLNPTYHFYCPATGAVDVLCYDWIPHPISPVSSPMPNWAPYFALAISSIQGDAGTIHSAPSQKGVVNTAVCFWIDNMGIPAEQDLTLVVPGAPDASGRQIFYTLLARIIFGGVQWQFGDPFDNTPDAQPPLSDCGSHPQLTSHHYRQISDDQTPDGRYHVTATESYSILVDLYYVDSSSSPFPIGPISIPLPAGISEPTISPASYPQYVGQVEGVPLGG